ncbi:hypothetical protein [Corynebacterium sp. H130]|uniref:hypothetical protein n=1 Tax=Corynebacterium sp. H130 TaxID=3133444 RepID=UPI0030974667
MTDGSQQDERVIPNPIEQRNAIATAPADRKIQPLESCKGKKNETMSVRKMISSGAGNRQMFEV